MIVVYLVIAVIVRALIIWWCVVEAKKKGRNTTTAGLLGLIFGLWAALGYAIVKNKVNPLCPKCNALTTLKTVIKGKDKGKRYYVCIDFPQCIGRIRA